MQTMPFMNTTQCHLCTQCQLCVQCHLCMLDNANYASGAHLALLHIWHCEWHCVMLYYASACQQTKDVAGKFANVPGTFLPCNFRGSLRVGLAAG